MSVWRELLVGLTTDKRELLEKQLTNDCGIWCCMHQLTISGRMFANFLSRLTAPDPDPLDQEDARLALTALLVRIARTDGSYSEDEIALIDKISQHRFNISNTDAKKLRGDAEVLESEAPDTVRFTRAIKSAVAYEDRAGVLEALWSVVLADGQRDDHEDALMRMVAPMLGISDRDSAIARQRVAQK